MALRRLVGWKNQNYWLEELLTDRFNQILAETEEQAWSRQKFFKLKKPVFSHYLPHAGDLASESQMELMLQTFWGLERAVCPEVPKDAWYRIVSRQIPLQPGLTEIARADLLACDRLGNPVLVELKSRWGVMIPLGLLIQAAEYAVRLKASWSFLHAEWAPYLERFGFPTPAIIPASFPSVVVAPSEFWSRLFATRTRFDQSLFASVFQKFANSKLPVQFMELREDDENQASGFRPRLQIIDLSAIVTPVSAGVPVTKTAARKQ